MNGLKIFLNLNCGIIQSDLNAISFDYNENLKRNEDYLNHYIYENKGDRYIEYIIKKIMVE